MLEARRRILGEEHPDTLASMNSLAGTLSDRGDHAGVQDLKERVLEASLRILGEGHPNTLASMNNLAATLSDRGDHARAQELLEQAVNAMRRQLGVEHPYTTAAWGLLQYYRAQRDTVSDERLLRGTLLWLLERDPDSLAEQQRRIRADLKQMIKQDEPREAGDPSER